MVSQLHKDLVAGLVKQYPELRTTGFRKAVRAALAESFGEEDPTGWMADDLSDMRLIPDAYVIVPEKREIVCFEVGVTNHFTKEKQYKYLAAFFSLDCECWGLGLVCVDRYGGIKAQCLSTLYLEDMARQVKGEKDEAPHR